MNLTPISRGWLTLFVAAVAACSLALTLHQIVSPSLLRIGPLRLRPDTARPLVLAASSGAILAIGWWRSLWLRAFAVAIIVGSGFLALVLIARAAPTVYPAADSAGIELAVIQASHGEQLLGAYSQFGWHHPGPMAFYLLVPFYVLGGRGIPAIDAGAFAINACALVVLAWALFRRRRANTAVCVSLFCAVALFVWRVPLLVSSAWNPHLAVLPFGALVIVAAAICSGEVEQLPLGVLLASFVVQAHVGLAPVSLAAMAAALAVSALTASLDDRRRLLRWVNRSAWCAAVVWALPMAEEIAVTPGNLTQIVRFFTSSGPSDRMTLASMEIWSGALLNVLARQIELPSGWAAATAPLWSAAAACSMAVALAIAGAHAWRRDRRFEGGLALVCVIAMLTGLWSVRKVPGLVGDYQVFWLSMLGAISAGLLAGYCLSLITGRAAAREPQTSFGFAASALFVLATAGAGARALTAGDRYKAMPENATVRELSEKIVDQVHALNINRAVIDADPESWGISAGVLLQFVKAGLPVAAEPNLVGFFGPRFARTGEEDFVLTICGPDRHRLLASEAGYIPVAEYDSEFVDGFRIKR